MNTPDTRPLAERTTPGRMHTFPLSDYLIIGEAPPAAGQHIARMTTRPDMEANAALIVEAFNVAHETGKTPRQLADERAELLAAILQWWKEHENDECCDRNTYSEDPPFVEIANRLAP